MTRRSWRREELHDDGFGTQTINGRRYRVLLPRQVEALNSASYQVSRLPAAFRAAERVRLAHALSIALGLVR